MKAVTKVAKRYAKAIFNGCSPDSLELTDQVLKAFVNALRDSAELREVLVNPAIQTKVKMEIVQDIVKPIAAGNAAPVNAILLLLENSRFSEIEGVSVVFNAMVETWKKMRSVTVTSAFELSSDERQKMESQIQRDLGGSATVTWEIDPSIIGGLQVKAADLLLDGSVRTSLERMRSALMQ